MAISYESLVVAPKSQEASVYKINQDSKVQNEQPIITQNQDQQNLRNAERTAAATENGKPDTHHDAREKSKNEYERLEFERKKKEKEEKDNEEHKKLTGSTFDITV
ncbi:MAG: hypothetical protein J6Z46_08300 [Lachnospiraceae bacterium]|nr:hypothetical protein [Lachnospiraceae bacterium]MBP5249987.1 hypothetical protein [Lachnospiraceae bacterium]